MAAKRRRKPLRRKCTKKGAKCTLENLGRRRHRQLAKSRGKKATPLTRARAVKIGRGRLKAIRKYNKKR